MRNYEEALIEIFRVPINSLNDTPSPANLYRLKKAVDEVLETLSEREKTVVELRYGLLDGHPKSLSEIGLKFNVTDSRIRQIVAKAKRMMRHPTRMRLLQEFLGEVNKADIQVQKSELERRITRMAEEMKILGPDEIMEVEIRIKKVVKVTVLFEEGQGGIDLDSINVRDLELSVRAKNCLSNANLNTIGDIRKKTLEEMLSCRNFGKKCVREVRNILLCKGVQLNWPPI